MLERLLHRLDRHRWVTLGVVLAAALAAGWHLPGLRVLDSPERWMPRTTLDAWRAVERHFDIGDNIGIGLQFQANRPLTEADLALLKGLRLRLEGIAGMSRVYDCSLVAEEIERVPLLTLLAPENAQRFAVYGGALWDVPKPGDPSRMLMTVCELDYFANETIDAPDQLNDRRRHVAAEVERIIDEERADPRWQDVEFHAASGVMMMGEMEKRTRQVAFRFLPLSLLIGLVALLWGFRSWQAFAVAMLGSSAATFLILGWLAARGGSLGVVTMATPALISVIATASTIHFAAYTARSSTAGAIPERSHLVSAVCVPCLGSALTTGLGFLLLWFNELAPIRDLGLGMFAGSLLAFFGVYVATHVMPIRDSHAGTWLAAQPMHRFCHGVTRFPLLMLLAAALCAAGLIFVAWPRGGVADGPPYGVRVDTDPFSFFSDDQPIKQALRRFAERKFPIFQLDVVLVPKTPQRPPVDLEPPDAEQLANVAAAKAFVDDVAQQKELGVVRVLSTLAFRERYEKLLQEIYERYRDEGPLAALYQFGGHATSANILSHSFRAWNVDKQNSGALRFTIVARDDNRDFSQLVRYVKGNIPDRFDGYLTGSVAQSVNLADGLRGSVLNGLGASMLIMGLICIALFRSLRLALIGAVPNIFPLIVVFGVMGWFNVPISSGSAMEMTVALGIGLTDTIHFMMHYRRRTRVLGDSVETAVQTTIREIGRPLVMTSLVHVAGFAIFLCTDFLPLRQFGLLASISMLAALVGDLVLLPNLLIVFDRLPRRSAAAATANSTVGEPHLLAATVSRALPHQP